MPKHRATRRRAPRSRVPAWLTALAGVGLLVAAATGAVRLGVATGAPGSTTDPVSGLHRLAGALASPTAPDRPAASSSPTRAPRPARAGSRTPLAHHAPSSAAATASPEAEDRDVRSRRAQDPTSPAGTARSRTTTAHGRAEPRQARGQRPEGARSRTATPSNRARQATAAQVRQRATALRQLQAAVQQRAQEIKAHRWQLPLASYHLTARFGETSGLWASSHTGLDFAAGYGSPIHAVAAGTVTSVGYAGAYGNRTIVTLQDGTEIWYCHQSSFAVSAGESVMPGELIGYVGATGNTTGPHLHLEVHPGGGGPVDPYSALVAHGLHP